MSNMIYLGLAGLLFLSAAIIWKMKRENFTTHQIEEKACVTRNDVNKDILSSPFIRLAVQGYNYQSMPIFFRDGKKITPMESSYSHKDMTYNFTLMSPKESKEHQWILETYDFVQPIVTNLDTFERCEVILQRRRFGFNRWIIYP